MDQLPAFILTSIILLALSGFFSATETAFTSLSLIKLKAMVTSGNKKAERALTICNNFDKLLTTLLIGNNIVNILLSTIATVFFTATIINKSYAAAISTAVITVSVLIFGEITPKNLAKENPEGFALSVLPVISFLIAIFTPFNFLFTLWKKLILKIFKVKKKGSVTEEDIITIVSEAENGGEIDKDEGEIIKSAITFGDLEVDSVMTPRVNVVAIELSDGKEDIYETFKKSGFSRLPVFEESIDNIIGIINLKDYYEKVMLGKKKPIEVVSRVPFISQFAKIDDVLKVLQKEKCHIGVVIDEHGGTAGIITMEDILEELVGEIYDERDKVSRDYRKKSDGNYFVKGSTEIYALPEELSVPESDEYATLAGWIILNIEKIPEKGEKFIIDGKNVRIISMDGNRIDNVEISIQDNKNNSNNNNIEVKP